MMRTYNGQPEGLSPRELIMHESISGLVTKVQDLKYRCDLLDSENADLLRVIRDMESSISGNADVQPPPPAAKLTGYASSDDSDSKCRPPLAWQTQATKVR